MSCIAAVTGVPISQAAKANGPLPCGHLTWKQDGVDAGVLGPGHVPAPSPSAATNTAVKEEAQPHSENNDKQKAAPVLKPASVEEARKVPSLSCCNGVEVVKSSDAAADSVSDAAYSQAVSYSFVPLHHKLIPASHQSSPSDTGAVMFMQ